MCLIAFALAADPRYRLILVGNRDEFHDRPAAALDWWPDAPDIAGGRDLQAGGTWLGVHRRGRVAAITNVREPSAPPPAGDEPSRGGLPRAFLDGDAPPLVHAQALAGTGLALAGKGQALAGAGLALAGKGQALAGTGLALAGTGLALAGKGQALAGAGEAPAGTVQAPGGDGRVPMAAYRGFNLLMFAAHPGGSVEGAWLSNRHPHAVALTSGIHGLSNHLLDTPWPKVLALKRALRAALASRDRRTLVEKLFGALADTRPARDAQLPATGLPQARERLLSAAFVDDPSYGTRASSVLLIDADGELSFEERSWPRHGPASGPIAERRLGFAIA